MTSKLTRLTDEELAEIAFYAGESTCHPDPNYQLGFESLATGSAVLSIVRELQERRKAYSEPVAWWTGPEPTPTGEFESIHDHETGSHSIPLYPLYRHAQLSVVPDAIPASRDIDAGYLSGWNDCRATMLKEENATKWWHGLYKEIKGRGQRHEGDFTPDLSMSTEEVIDEINGWTENHKANAALIMLDRIDTVDPADDDRIEDIKRIVRELANNQKEVR